MRNAAEIAATVCAGRESAVSVTRDALERIERDNPGVNAFTGVWADEALAQAQAVDAAVAAGRDPGPLAGAPFAVKNLYDVAGHVTLAGSIIQADQPPAARDATLVARLKAAGAVLVGTLNMDEYAYGFSTENVHYGPTHNPHDLTRIAGGSSGGSAAAVAAGMVPLSLGSDTNGSIRVPAALCGIFGLKATYGRLSRHGAFPFVHSFDHCGPFARTAADLTLVYDALQGPDPADDHLAQRPAEPADGASLPPRLRAGALGGWFVENAAAEVMAAQAAVARALAALPAELPGAKAARAAAFCITPAEGSVLHLADLRARPQDFDHAVRDRLIAGAIQPAQVVARAQRVRRAFYAEAMALFERFEVLVAPAIPFPATPIGQAMIEMGGAPVSVRANLGLYTQPISCIGLPVVTVPFGRSGGLPVGVQLIGAPWSEALLLALARRLEADGVVGAPLPGGASQTSASA